MPKSNLAGAVVEWDQGINFGGGFGQITPQEYLILATDGRGDLSDLLGEQVTLSFGGALSGKSFTSTITEVGPASSTLRVLDQWDLLGITRAVGLFGTATITFPGTGGGPEEPEEQEEPDPPGVPDPPANLPVFGSAVDPLNTQFRLGDLVVMDDQKNCSCQSKNWLWLVLVAVGAWWIWKKAK